MRLESADDQDIPKVDSFIREAKIGWQERKQRTTAI
jgi:hypothetical protein